MNRDKRTIGKIIYHFVFAIVLLTIATFLYGSFDTKELKRETLSSFNQIFKTEEVILDSLNASTTSLFSQSHDIDSVIQQITPSIPDQYRILVFKNDTLQYWSNNDWSFYSQYSEEQMGDGIHRLPNGWYFNKTQNLGKDIKVVTSFVIKEEFSYTNKYLKPKFIGAFSRLDNLQLYDTKTIFSSPIYTNDGKIALYASYTPPTTSSSEHNYLLFCLIFTSMVLLYSASMRTLLLLFSNIFLRLTTILITYILLFLLYSQYIIPHFHLTYFAPYTLAISDFIDSLGIYHLMSITIFSFVVTQNIVVVDWSKDRKNRCYSIYILLYLVTATIWYLLCYYLQKGIENSHINPFFAEELQFTIPNILFALSIVLIFYSFVISIQTWSQYNETIFKNRSIHYLLAYLIPFIGLLEFPYQNLSYLLIILSYSITITIQLNSKVDHRLKYRFMILFVFTVLGASTYVIFSKEGVAKRSNKHREVYTEKITNERDPHAELLFDKISNRIANDSLIMDMLPRQKRIRDYIIESYFRGYLTKYNTAITLYRASDQMELGRTDKWIPVDDFFNLLIIREGINIKDTQFSFLQSMDGRITYLGKFNFQSPYRRYVLIIELSSKTFDEGKGYPELLLDDRIQEVYNTKSTIFSYARYHQGNIVMQRGAFHYPSRLDAFKQTNNKPYNGAALHRMAYDHKITELNDDITLVVSYKTGQWNDIIVNFSYAFILYYSFGIILMLFFFNRRRPIKAFELKHKIQYTIIILVLTPLLILAGGIIVYNYIQFNTQMKQDLNRKVKEVTASLQINFSDTNMLTPESASFIGEELNHLSEILWTDINLYDTQGIIAATSRPEIFRLGLVGNRMNRKAFNELCNKVKRTYIHTEHIGSLKYLSIYVPFRNNEDKILGYINIPYFSKNSDLIKQITTFIITFINLFVIILLFCLTIAIIISQKLTSPLTMIEEKIGDMKFGESNEKIKYQANDEIGKLVMRYNEKVDELKKSAKLLAKNEREEAWREMARQIAHEIKNPLTPMKLNIQYLQKMHDNQSENFNKYFNKVTQTLVEQIDTLSNIATSFSSFAKIPSAYIERINLQQSIQETIALFSSSGTIYWDNECQQPMIVLADKEQLGRLFINLIKNAQQAVVEGEESIITLTTSEEEHRYVISIQDNGPGISKDVQERLFEPYFTTKSQGTGLGLAIVKKIVETIKGTIIFKTEEGFGTNFTIYIPKAVSTTK
ncbi:GHKL domain-containing protein [Halosquirtibacter xylanolyticus]|uniref:sensor histidine kinase n=1 Tax=Halosquirtibacter xylanolyticus TaxID=3374599 RepID=UPI00374A73E8|nr:GHKL domain-containing protein [Prolixibacteraceae bacterium]